MTRYLLCGGNDRAYSEFVKNILEEIYHHSSHPKVLSCMFAVSDTEITSKFQSWSGWWQGNGARFKEYVCADRSNFVGQIREADTIFFHGGNNDLLFNFLNTIPDVERYFDGKLVIGSSAGANWLSKAFFSRSAGGWRKGSGIVPLSIMVHYGVSEEDSPNENWEYYENKITSFNGDKSQDIVRIKEGQIIAYENH